MRGDRGKEGRREGRREGEKEGRREEGGGQEGTVSFWSPKFGQDQLGSGSIKGNE
jgi:hypothetical protein